MTLPVQMSPISTRAAAQFIEKTVTYNLVNGSPTPFVVSYAGQTLRVPGCNDIVKRTKFGDTFHSIMRDDGSYIPGTLKLWDIYGKDDKGLRAVVFDAKLAVWHILGMNGKDPVYLSENAAKGLRYAPDDSSEDDIELLKEESRSGWEEFTVDNMRNMLMLDRELFKDAASRPNYWPGMLRMHRKVVEQIAAERGVSVDAVLGFQAERSTNMDAQNFAAALMKAISSITAQQAAPVAVPEAVPAEPSEPVPPKPKYGRGKYPRKASNGNSSPD